MALTIERFGLPRGKVTAGLIAKRCMRDRLLQVMSDLLEPHFVNTEGVGLSKEYFKYRCYRVKGRFLKQLWPPLCTQLPFFVRSNAATL